MNEMTPEQQSAEIERLKAREARFIQYCDSLSAMLLDLVQHHRDNKTVSVILEIQEKHGVDLAPIFNPEIQWYRFSSQDEILEKWLNAYISEGLAVDLLGVGRIEARVMMEAKYGMDWRSARESFVQQREDEELNQG